MIRRPSRHQNCILKRIAFRADPVLRSVPMITFKSSSATGKHTDQRWEINSQLNLARSNNHWWVPLILTSHIPHHAFPIDIT